MKRSTATLLALAMVGWLPSGVPAARAADLTAFSIDSLPGSAFGNGRTFVALESDMEWATGRVYDDGGWLDVSFALAGPGYQEGSWSVSFGAAPGETLTPGTYTGAVRTMARGAGQPGLDLTGLGSGCNEVTGAFTIHELARAGTELQVLSASFHLACGNQPVVHGEVRLHASSGFQSGRYQPTELDLGRAVAYTRTAPGTVTVTALGTRPLEIGTAAMVGADAVSFRIGPDTCSGSTLAVGASCELRVTARPTAAGVISAAVRIPDGTDRGARQVMVTANGALQTWGPVHAVSRDHPYSWSSSNALAATTARPWGFVHAAFESVTVKGRFITDRGPFAPVLVKRAMADETGWFEGVRVNPVGQHGIRSAIAGSGGAVHVAWVGVRRLIPFQPTAPRVLYVRSNRDSGEPDAWGPIIRLTSLRGRVDAPTVAADGDRVRVTWTDSVTGSIRLATSRDAGITWSTTTVGSTRSRSDSGFYGAPLVAADGDLVIVAWWPLADATVRARISTDGGATWASPSSIGASVWQPAVAARSGRAVVALSGARGLVTRTWTTEGWAPARNVPRISGTRAQMPAIALRGTDAIGLVYSACTDRCGYAGKGITRSSIGWRYSTDGGASWTPPTMLAPSIARRPTNDWPSVVWPEGQGRAVLFDGSHPRTSSREVDFVGAGSVDPAASSSHEVVAPAGVPPTLPVDERRLRHDGR